MLESQCWRVLLEKSELSLIAHLAEIKQETDELVAIIIAIVVNKKQNKVYRLKQKIRLSSSTFLFFERVRAGPVDLFFS